MYVYHDPQRSITAFYKSKLDALKALKNRVKETGSGLYFPNDTDYSASLIQAKWEIITHEIAPYIKIVTS